MKSYDLYGGGPNGDMPFRLGMLQGRVVGGPYKNIPDGMFGVKMAAELNLPCDVDIPTKDFNVPDVTQLKQGVMKAIMAMATGQEVYAGCMGGIGRTGLFLAAMAKVMIEYRRLQKRRISELDPVLYVRETYMGHAVETQQQQDYIKKLDVADIAAWWKQTQPLLYKVPVIQMFDDVEGGKFDLKEPHYFEGQLDVLLPVQTPTLEQLVKKMVADETKVVVALDPIASPPVDEPIGLWAKIKKMCGRKSPQVSDLEPHPTQLPQSVSSSKLSEAPVDSP